MDHNEAHKISQHPKYRELVSKRARYSWAMTLLVLFIYFGFIYLVAFHKEYLAQKISENSIITLSIPLGIGVILSTVILTGIYVNRSNKEFDVLTHQIKRDLK